MIARPFKVVENLDWVLLYSCVSAFFSYLLLMELMSWTLTVYVLCLMNLSYQSEWTFGFTWWTDWRAWCISWWPWRSWPPHPDFCWRSARRPFGLPREGQLASPQQDQLLSSLLDKSKNKAIVLGLSFQWGNFHPPICLRKFVLIM